MQQNNQGGFRRFLRKNGYYLVICLCAAAVGVSGFYLLRSAKKTRAALSVPAAVETAVPSSAASPAAEAAAALPPETAGDAAEAVELQPSEQIPAARVVVMPVSGDTLAPYSTAALSYNATTRDWRTHDGVDLAASEGAPVAAAEAGTVSAVYDDDYFGTTVEIAHSSGYTTRYANLANGPAVGVGQTVAAGETIGAVGGTALLESGEAPHLHFAVLRAGVAVDPAEYLS